MMAKRR